MKKLFLCLAISGLGVFFGGCGAQYSPDSSNAPDETRESALSIGTPLKNATGMHIGIFDSVLNGSNHSGIVTEAGKSKADSVRLLWNVSRFTIPSSASAVDKYCSDQKSGDLDCYAINYNALIAAIQAYKAKGFWVTLSFASNTNCTDYGCPGKSGANGNYGTFMNNFMGQLKSSGVLGGIDAIEIWQEWDNPGYGYNPNSSVDSYKFRRNSNTTAYTTAEYTSMFLVPGYAAIKKYSNTIKIYSGAVVMNHESKIGEIAKSFDSYVDGYGYHPYQAKYTDLLNNIKKAYAQIPSTSSKKLVLSEWGCTYNTGSGKCGISSEAQFKDFILNSLQGMLGMVGEADWLVLSDPSYASESLLNGASETNVFKGYQDALVPCQTYSNCKDSTRPPVLTDLKGSKFLVKSVLNSGYNLDVQGGNKNPGAAVDLFPSNGGANQSFQWNNGNGLVTFSGTCVIVSGGKIMSATCTGASNQSWKYDATKKTLTWASTGTVLDIPRKLINAGTQTVLELFNSNAGTNQQWTGPTAN